MGKIDPGSPRSERKMSSSSTSMKTKWLKAFRSLKPATAIAGTVKYADFIIILVIAEQCRYILNFVDIMELFMNINN